MVGLALRQQLAVYARRHPRPRLSTPDRAFWVVLSRLWPRWRHARVLVKPETVVRWRRQDFRCYWRWVSPSGPGRPLISEETKTQPELDPLQRWMTFLRNHRDLIAGMDSFVAPTVRFRLLYAWFAIDHGQRRMLHCNVTESPTALWVIQQLREAFPDEPTHRFLIFDNDAIVSTAIAQAVLGLGARPNCTAFQSPWHNGTAGRFVGRVPRELLGHVVVLHEDHLRRLLREYVAYYNAERVRTSIGDAQAGRAALPGRSAAHVPPARNARGPLTPPRGETTVCASRAG